MFLASINGCKSKRYPNGTRKKLDDGHFMGGSLWAIYPLNLMEIDRDL